ncbi:uncharacterized protein LOC128270120 [Anopheles cruzii]|uniref:uncharacterized protein LOC128270120 n=1 Tax=Anopheles cruzii TaxID=68878 RepID=UPI0022EC3E02|nr:uncharacterized protein LOC128270120 [Anopheles cruzii]
MMLQRLVPCLVLLQSATAGYLAVPLQSPASVTFVNSQQHAGLLAGPVRLTTAPAAIVDARSAAVSVSQQAPAPQFYSYNVQQPVFGKPSYTPTSVQYHSYGNPSVRVYDPRSFVYTNSVPTTTHTVQQQVPVTVTTQYHHDHHQIPTVYQVPAPKPTPVPVPTLVPVPVAPTYTKTVTTGPTYITPPPPPPPLPVPEVKHVPVVRSRKFKVRRPAIQNQFYDIEERVIIRPVGSALVELEQPISQTETRTKTTTKTTFAEKHPIYVSVPAPVPVDHTVSEHGEEELYKTRIGRPQVVTQTTTVYTERPTVTRKDGYDRIQDERTVQAQKSAASTAKSSDAEFIDAPGSAVPQEPQPIFTQGHAIYHQGHQTAYLHPFAHPHLAPHPYVYHPGNAGHLLHHVAYVDQQPHTALLAPHPAAHPGVFHVPSSTTPLYPVIAPARDCDDQGPPKAPHYLPPTVTPVAPITPSQPPVGTTTPYPPSSTPGTLADDEDDYEDSIVVNARGGSHNLTEYATMDSDTDYDTATIASTAAVPSSNRYHDKYRGEQQSSSQQSSSQQSSSQQRQGSIEITYATRPTPASDIVAFDPSTSSSGGFDLGPLYSTPRGFSFPSTTPRTPATTLMGSSSYAPSSSSSSSSAASSTAASQRSVTVISSTTPLTLSARFSEDSVSSSASHQATASSQSLVVGQGLTREQIHENQKQFIKLLSERDSIAQVGYGGPKGETTGSLLDAYVRSRVLSATPAPHDAKETSRTVNIRRIIVSRPVETEQEVEVREQAYATTLAPPSTDYEHKRDVSEVSTVSARSDGGQLGPRVPVYVDAKPPAFVNESDQ